MFNDFTDEQRHNQERDHDRNHNHNHDQDPSGKFSKVCEVNASEDIRYTVPVEIRGHINTHDVNIECMGHEIIKERNCKKNVRRFKIRQKIHVCIPIDCVAEVEIGDGDVDFSSQEA